MQPSREISIFWRSWRRCARRNRLRLESGTGLFQHRSYAIEEAAEVVDAIEREDLADLRDELGDLLLQSGVHARWGRARPVRFRRRVEAVTTR